MALMMKKISSFMPRLSSVAAPTTPSLFSTSLRSPFAHFAATRFNLSYADIARMLKIKPSLDNPQTLQNVERVVHLLTQHGCTQHHIARIMKSQPTILGINAQKLLQPKIQLLKDLGFDEKELPKLLIKGPTILGTNLHDVLLPNITFLKDLGIGEKELPKLLLKAPRILCLNLQDALLPKITFLKSLFQSQNFLLKAVKLNPYILTCNLENTLRPSLAFWEGCGLQREELARFLSSKPSLLAQSVFTPSKLDLIRNIGVCKESKTYKHVLSLVASLRVETLESKMDNLRQWGLSAEEIWELFRRCPSIFGLSKNTLRKKMEFVVKTMELTPNSVVKHYKLLRNSLEKVVKPRFVVFQHMNSLNRIEHLKSKQLHALIAMSETDFVNKILKGHPELETLYALHKETIPNV